MHNDEPTLMDALDRKPLIKEVGPWQDELSASGSVVSHR